MNGITTESYADTILASVGIDLSERKITHQKQLPLENMLVSTLLFEQHLRLTQAYTEAIQNALMRIFVVWCHMLGPRNAFNEAMKIVTRNTSAEDHYNRMVIQNQRFQCSISHSTQADYVPKISKMVCIHYAIHGTCKGGDRCKMPHLCPFDFEEHCISRCNSIDERSRSRLYKSILAYGKQQKYGRNKYKKDYTFKQKTDKPKSK